MLALTLLMVVVAILVGLIASRVSASIGRELRRETFSSVIHFSNAEIENFSTASLITRTTNDIQQVQFTCVILLRMVAYAPILGIGGVMHVTQGNTGLAWIIVLDVAALLLLITALMSIAMPRFKIMQTLVDKLNPVSYTHLDVYKRQGVPRDHVSSSPSRTVARAPVRCTCA